jgi:hypothetical protein
VIEVVGDTPDAVQEHERLLAARSPVEVVDAKAADLQKTINGTARFSHPISRIKRRGPTARKSGARRTAPRRHTRLFLSPII